MAPKRRSSSPHTCYTAKKVSNVMRASPRTQRDAKLAQSDGPLGFTDLPPEVRNKIYGYVVGAAPASWVPNPELIRGPEYGPRCYEPALAKTCHQVREELLPLFYAKKHFVWDLLDLHFCPLITWVKDLEPSLAKLITHLIIDVEDGTWGSVLPWLKARETYLSPSVHVLFRGHSTLADAIEGACDIGIKLRKAKIRWEIVENVLASNSNVVGAALGYGMHHWPTPICPDHDSDEEDSEDSEHEDDDDDIGGVPMDGVETKGRKTTVAPVEDKPVDDTEMEGYDTDDNDMEDEDEKMPFFKTTTYYDLQGMKSLDGYGFSAQLLSPAVEDKDESVPFFTQYDRRGMQSLLTYGFLQQLPAPSVD